MFQPGTIRLRTTFTTPTLATTTTVDALWMAAQARTAIMQRLVIHQQSLQLHQLLVDAGT
jgi:hypothetical protein